MDFSKKLNSLPILQKVLISLFITLIVYLTLVRPLRINFGQNYLFPKISKIANNHSILIETNFRRIYTKISEQSSPIGFGIPFGGYFWLPLSIFFALKNKPAIYGLVLYNLFLLIIPPLLFIQFLKGEKWLSLFFDINEMIFLSIFLISMFFSLRETYQQWVLDNMGQLYE